MKRRRPGYRGHYRASYAAEAERMCIEGATTDELAYHFGRHKRIFGATSEFP
jgi:hypothetical protein